MSAADEAYGAVEDSMAESARLGATHLDFSDKQFRALEALPPLVAMLTQLTSLKWL